ncbi:MAG: hypothetical protein US50_C0050G0016 [Candidatus Nomurabacteria bacterium GW2011_GWB1_37_5]|uniref:Probable endolytic peptidoglycan transglycosylase RlpA n=1 Tax=Candidatus Nomurabacteria bacterium GW2011_GWB1_37_5 TaxID=1618742 RepID=A0A0G0GTM6_9BACT|nr:MAG: hypothetical protein US50_C0050G0016 [Candidatus Nomurabacteria bacterium GW2011_GWB1_37_5]
MKNISKFLTFIIVFNNLFFFGLKASAESVDYCAGLEFTGDLKIGITGQEVKCLQIILNNDPITTITKTGVGSPGQETDMFGKLTQNAVSRFQEKYSSEILKPGGLKKGNGYVGKLTKIKLNKLLTELLGNKKLKTTQTLSGKASYYANSLQSNKTASGERYDGQKYTAAHKTLPFGTKVRVVNTKNNRSVVVKINDRGPFVKNRLIDLSRIAAKDIGLLSAGVVNAKVYVLK